MIQRCLKTILLFSGIFLSGVSNAQTELFPFEDYGHCTTGFINNNYLRDTVYQAVFENAVEITYPFQTRWNYMQGLKFWILSDNGKFGCLCSNGEWILERLYDTLSLDVHSNQFIAKLNGKAGTLKTAMQQGFPFEYDEIYSDQTYFDAESYDYSYHSYDEYYVRKNKLLGVYTFDGKEIVSPQYDSIQAIGWSARRIDSIIEKEFYLCSKNKLKGLLAQNGKVILEPQYRKIQSFYQSQRVGNTILFRVTDTLGRNAVFDEAGKQLAPFSPFEYSGVITEWTNQQFQPAGFASEWDEKKKQQRMTNLATGKSSPWYPAMHLVGDWVMVQQKAEWLVLDKNFDTLIRNSHPNELLLHFDYSNELKNTAFIQNATEPFLPEVAIFEYESINYDIQEVFVIKRFKPVTRSERKRGEEPECQYAWLNVSTGATSAFYDKIVRLGTKGVYYYWCFNKSGEEQFAVSVFDGKGNLLQSINVESGLEDWLSNSYAVRRIYDKKYPFFTYRTEDGKYTAYGIEGWKPGLPDVSREVIQIVKWENGNGYFQFIDSASAYYYFDLNGKPLLGGKHYFYSGSGYYSNDQEKWVVPMKKDGVFSYINEHLEVLLDSCQEIRYVPYHSVQGLEPTPKNFAIRNGFVYAVLKDSFLLVDAKLFLKPKGMNQIGKDFFVNDSGKMYSEDEVRIYRNSEPVNAGDLILSVKNNQLTLRKIKHFDDRAGTVLRVVPDIYDYEIVYNGLKVITTDKKEGYIDKETGAWLLKPVYEHTQCLGSGDQMIRFAKSSGTEDKHWFVVDKNGQPLTKPIFDEPFYFDYLQDEWAYAYSDGKMGLINQRFEWVTKPEYYDREQGYAIFLLAVDHYAIVDNQTGKSFGAPHDSVALVYGKPFFWFNDSIQILDSDGTELLSPVSVSEATVSGELRKYFQENMDDRDPINSDSTYLWNGMIYCPQSNRFLNQLSNECILENAKHNLQIFQRYEGRYVFDYSMHADCKREPLFITNRFFSEKVSGDCYEQPELYERYNQQFSFRNYRIINDQLVRVYCVGDLLKQEPHYEDRLNKLLETRIQNNQIFGIACTNMPAAIEELKRNFYVENGDFHFLYYELGEYEGTITLAFDEIKDLLREPEAYR